MAAIQDLPNPVDLSHHLSRNAKNRVPSSMKSFYKYFLIPGIGQLAGGLPNESYFPYDDFEARVALPDRFKPTPNKPVDPPTAELAASSLSDSPQSARLVVPHTSGTSDPLRKIDLDTALQYGTAQGYPPLYQFVRQFTTQNLHPNVPYRGGPEVILTCGSTDGFSKVIQALTEEWNEDRDPIDSKQGILVEEYCYTNAVQGVRPRGLNIVPVKIDDEGMLAKGPGGLEDVLDSWDPSRGRRPHLIYTVTIGQNPTSGVLSVQRRKEIYELAVKYDIIIVEDDPYWYLQYPSSNPNFNPQKPEGKSSGFDFLDSLVPSSLSIDYQGRVVRIDTFSKTVAPGCRLGWITAQPALIERILRLTETSTQQPSGFVQAMIAELVMGPQSKGDGGQGGAKDGSGWDVSGWVRWLEGLRGNYERRMNAMCDVLDSGKHIVKTGRRSSLSELVRSTAHPTSINGAPAEDVDDWAVVETSEIYNLVRPLGGMFVWVRFDFTLHPLANKIPHARLSRALWVFWTTPAYRVLVSPGNIFAPTQDIFKRDGHNCFRMCFAACPEEDVVPITKRFVKGARAFFRIKDPKQIEEILKDDDPGAEGAYDNMQMGSLAGFGFC
ncbi:Aminotransferase class I/classII [Botryosphaeria dothidea]|uniref:Aminotransferase class I/classII n=1 Tax=Botryosphaeria dothidea TaxID=55169 RepID=A0A8H4N0T7_9PEZI|nr:Aminotransferase class I/classII [Botryosphaeria dothidea]